MRAWRAGLGLALSFAMALCAAAPVLAQGVVQQSGPIVAFHAPAWYRNGVLGDGGGVSTPYLSALGLFGGSTCPLGVSSQTGPGSSTSPHSQFTICQTNAATTFTFAGVNGQPNPAVYFNVGGVNYSFPGPGGGTVLGPSSAVSGNFACFNTTSGTILADCGVSPASIFTNPTITGGSINNTAIGQTTPTAGAFTVLAGSVTAAGSTTTRSLAKRFADVVNVLDYGAKCDGSTDDASAINSAIAAAQSSSSSAEVTFPSAVCAYQSPLVVTAGIKLQGSSKGQTHLLCQTGAADCIYVHGASYASQMFGFQMEDLYLDHGTKTGGYALDLQYVVRVFIKNIAINNPWNGINVYVTNDVYIEDVDIQGLVGGSGTCAIYYHAPGDGSARADGFTTVNVVSNNLYSGGDGMCWDGFANTWNAFQTTALNSHIGLKITNTAGSNQFFPNFGEFVNFNTDGASAIGCDIEAGTLMQFVDGNCSNTSGSSGQGSADTYALKIGEDNGGSFTNTLQFTNEKIGLSKSSAAYIAGRDVQFNNTTFVAGSTTINNTVPAVEIATGAQDITFEGNTIRSWGSPTTWKYGVQVDPGTFRVVVVGNNFSGAQTRSILWNGTDANSLAANNQSDAPSATPPAGITATGATTLTAANVAGGALIVSGTPGAFTATMPTAANLVAQLQNPYQGASLTLLVVNATNGIMTVAPGAGMTFGGALSGGDYTIAIGGQRTLTFYFTSTVAGAETVNVTG